ncbi:hypothetical protein Tsubulata_014797 [Turnera subulata]|uniref:Wall-associated receptor kinase galacturonan-binding domain-containing protein n=1 Tax=Turnera subulata TaxID=218843 RepID=A0A9Q0G8P5_9ROSI|nr:hypothetical protein Tsubulata_014797 [Turnera subulata]
MEKLVISALSLMFMFLLLENIPPAKADLDCGNQTCGSIRIPYPFGLAPECYKDEWFKIECNKSFAPPRAFIPSIKAEVLEFSADMGSITVKGPIKSSGNCSSARKRGRSSSSISTLLNLTGSPFVLSFQNRFIAVGCNTLGTVSEDSALRISCKSTCRKERVASDWDYYRFCEGKNCCMAPVQTDLQVVNPSVQSLNSSYKGSDEEEEEECRLAFLVDELWLVKTVEDSGKLQEMGFVPLKLLWVSNFSYDTFRRTTGCENSNVLNSSIVKAAGCRCIFNYEGSPYNPQGCTGLLWGLCLSAFACVPEWDVLLHIAP